MGKLKEINQVLENLTYIQKLQDFKFLTKNSQKITQFLSTGTYKRIATDSSGKQIELPLSLA